MTDTSAASLVSLKERWTKNGLENIKVNLLRFYKNIVLMIGLGHITAKTYLMLSLILAATLILSFIGEGFSADPQGGSMPAKPPSNTQPLVPQESTKSQGKIVPEVKTSIDKRGNVILSSDISSIEKIDSLILPNLHQDLQNLQGGYHRGYTDGYKLAKKGGSINDLINMMKTTNLGSITGMTDMTNVGYDRGISNGYRVENAIIEMKKNIIEMDKTIIAFKELSKALKAKALKKTTSEKPK